MADLAKLVVKLEADSAKLLTELERTNKKLSRFEMAAKKSRSALKDFAAIGATAFVGASAAIGAMSVKALNLADKIAKLSQSTGLSSEQLSRLRHQAALSGVEFDSAAKAVAKFQRAMFDANDGLKAQSDAFASLGVNIITSSGQLRDSNDVMLDVADKFKLMEDGAKKSALAQVLFGRSGVALIPLLNQGRDGLAEMAKEADELGITMDGKLTAASERVNDNMTRVKTALEGVFLRVIAQAMPHIEAVSKAMVKWSKDTNNVQAALSFLGNTIKVLATGAVILKSVFNSIGKVIGGVVAAVVLATSGNFAAAGEALAMPFEDARVAVVSDMETLDKIWSDVPAKIASQADSKGAQIASPIIEAQNQIEGTFSDIEKTVQAMEKLLTNAQKKSDKIVTDLNKRFSAVTSPKFDAGAANSLDVGNLELQAQQLANVGDIDGAVDKLNQAFDVLEAMKDSGSESSIVIQGLADKLKAVGEQVGRENLAQAEVKVTADLENFKALLQSGMQETQALLDANPLVQQVLIKQDVIPTASEQTGNKQNVTLNMPNGGQMQFESDAAEVEYWRREFAREAQKRGKQ